MKKTWVIILGAIIGLTVLIGGMGTAEEMTEVMAHSELDPDMTAKAEPVKPAITKKTIKKKIEKANAFVADSDWEFDGFVAGGQDQNIKSMFYLNDLIYLNVGTQQGYETGDQINVYKRGERVRDPQSGKFMGYEVRRAAITEITDKVEDETCVVRILKSNEPVEIGDLIKRED